MICIDNNNKKMTSIHSKYFPQNPETTTIPLCPPPQQEQQEQKEDTEIHPQVQYLLQLPQHPQRSKEWFAQRKDRLTASDIDTILGRNPYAKPNEVLFKKCNLPKPFIGNQATLHGQKYENEALDVFCKLYNKVNQEVGLLPHSTIDWLAGSPDGITNDGIVLEVKCPLRRQIVMGKIPKYYYAQIQINLEICNLDQGIFIEYRPAFMNETNKYLINVVEIPRNRQWFEETKGTLEKFWQEILKYREIGIENHPDYTNFILKHYPEKIPLNERKKDVMCLFENDDDDDYDIILLNKK